MAAFRKQNAAVLQQFLYALIFSIFRHRPLHFSQTAATLKIETSTLFLKSQQEQRQRYLEFVFQFVNCSWV
jgi:hypothetical protein